MRTVWLLLLFAASLQASVIYEGLGENEECEKWEYHPMGDFQAPEFIAVPSYSDIGYGEVEMLGEVKTTVEPLVEFYGPEFESVYSNHGNIELLGELQGQKVHSTASSVYDDIELLDDVKTTVPSSVYDDIELLDSVKTTPDSLKVFHGPQFAQASLDDFHGPRFESTAKPSSVSDRSSDIELLDDVKTTPKVFEDFYGPQFESTVKPASVGRYSDVELLGEVKTTPKAVEDFYGPQFESTVKPASASHRYSNFELLDDVKTTQPPFEDFHGPQFESKVKLASSNDYNGIDFLDVQQTTQPPFEDFHGPQFETTTSSDVYGEIEMFDSETTTRTPVFNSPQFESKQLDAATQRTENFLPVESQEYGVPQFSPINLGNAEDHYKKPIHRGQSYKVHDEFSNGRVSEPVVESVYEWPKSSKVQDQFVIDEEIVDSKPKYVRRPIHRGHEVHDGFVHDRVGDTVFESAHNWPKSSKVQDHFATETIDEVDVKPLYKKRPVYSAKPIRKVHDDFASAHSEKVVIEPASLPPKVAKVQDEFAIKKKKERKPFYYVAPVAQFFFGLLAPQAPVHDSFSNGLSEKIIVEPIIDHPKLKVAVHDEFSIESGDRSKRSVTPTSSVWKLVCVKRRQKTRPIARTLTAADFSEYAHMTNDRISRCIGRKEGENVAAGSCKKFYLRCASIINVMMCSQLNEVFSEAKKTCVPKTESSECNLLREIDSQKIVFSKKSDEPEDNVIEDPQEFCYDRPDGFYQDNKNCSRVIQCFDNEFVEYPSCPAPLAFNLKRGKCDRRENVPSCINN